MSRCLGKIDRLVFGLLLCLVSLQLYSQTSSTAIPLQQVLSSLETKFEVRFSYSNQTIEAFNIVPPIGDLTLEESLKDLSSKTQLEFKTIANRYIAVYTAINAGNLSICGTIINTQSGAPVDGATIRGESAVVSTNEAGFFQLDGISRNEEIAITYLGFDVKTLNGEELNIENSCPFVFVDLTLNFLDTVVLENFMAKGISRKAEGSIAIAQEDLEIQPNLIEPDILQIVQILPGIESIDETTSNINIRGGKNDEVLLLWNDIRMYQSSHFFGLVSALNPNLTQNVTVYKNGTHARYGESASGVISMASEEKVPDEVSGGAGVNFISANLYARIPASEEIAFNVSGRTSINSGIGNPVYDQFFNRIFQNTLVTNINNNSSQGLRSANEDFRFYDISLKGIWDFTEKDKLSYSFLTIDNSLDFTELFVSQSNSSSNQSMLKQSSTINGAQWTRNWNPKFSTRINWHGSNYKLDESNREVNTDETTAQVNEVAETEFKVESSYKFTTHLHLEAGYSYTDTEIIDKGEGIVTTDNNLVRNAIFLQTKWKVDKTNTIVSAGSRYTFYPSLEQQFLEPRIHLWQKISNRLSATFSGELKHQGVQQFTDVDNPFLGVENKRWVLSNSNDLPILESEQWELGIAYKDANWALSTSVFRKLVDQISASTQGFRNQLIDASFLGGYESMGVEVSVNRKARNLNLWLSYSFLNSDYNFTEIIPNAFPNSFAVTHSVNFAATYQYNSFLFSLGSTFRSGNPFTRLIPGNEFEAVNNMPVLNYESPNSGTLDPYFRNDFSAAYEFRIDDTFRGKINLALLNLFDRKNALETYFQLNTDENDVTTVTRIEQFSLGFTPNISFQLIF